MEKNIIKLIQSIDPSVNINNIKYSNNSIDLKELISLSNFRLEMYNKTELDAPEKDNVKNLISFLNKKIKNYNFLVSLGIVNIKMVEVNNDIYYFDEDFRNIYLIVDNIQREIKYINH